MTTIEQVDRIPLYHRLDEPFGNGQGFVGHREYLIIRIVDSDGAVGYGECIGPVAGTDQIIEHIIAPALLDTAADVALTTLSRVTDSLRRRYKSYVPLGAVGGVELALWDLRGRSLGRPVGELLGGRFHEAVPAYVTGHYFTSGLTLEQQVQRIADEAQSHVDSGFRTVKLKIGLAAAGHGPDADGHLMAQVRSRLDDEVALMADANCAYDLMQARRVGRYADELGYHWLEEPLPATDISGYAALSRDLTIPVSAGESWGDPAVFQTALDQRAVSLLQPDVVAAGGLEPMRRVCQLAADRGVASQPHVWGTAIAMAAALQFLTSRADAPLFEYDASPNPVRDELLAGQLPLVSGGTVGVPAGAGFGIDVDPLALERFRDPR